MQRRPVLGLTAATTALALLGSCAAVHQLTAEVSTFGDWPAGEKPGSYAFERLPSQQANADEQQRLEDAARPALARAGFEPVAAGAEPDRLVQVGTRVSRSDYPPWDDPLWWRGGFGVWHRAPWRGPYWGGPLVPVGPRYDREVALLIRDRASGKPLVEAHASSEGFQSSEAGLLRPLFAAALFDFPARGINPRAVTVPLAAD